MTTQRQLGVGAALAIVTGESVALGIFLTPAAMAKSLGSPALVLAVWLGMGAMAMCGALCYSELAVRSPESGGEYVYLRAGYGDRVAFLYGWMSTVVMYPGVAAALAFGAAGYVAALVPGWSAVAAVFPALLLLGFGAVNLFGSAFSGRLLTVLNLLKFAVLFGLVAWAAVSGKAHLAHLQPFTTRHSGSEALFGAVAGAVVSAFFSLGGWWEAGKIAGEVRNPRRTLPLAFVGGVALVIAVYLLVTFSFLAVVPLGELQSSTDFVSQFGGALFGAAGARVLSVCVLLCVLGGVSALTMVAPRVCMAMARSGALPELFGRVHDRFGTPWNAVLLQTGLALLVLGFGAFDRMLAYVIFTAVVFLRLTVSTHQRLPRVVRAWWYPSAPIFFIFCCAAVALLIVAHDPLPALAGTAAVLCGDPVSRWMRRKRNTQIEVLERS